jgi:nucleotide-binding universal stress UspA family protein
LVSTTDQPGHRIVAGIDGSPASLSALEWAAHQAQLTDTSLEVVAAWEWPTGLGWSVIPEGFDPAGETRETLEPILAALRTAHPQVSISLSVVEGTPALALVKASRGADLLVVGSRGHGEFVGMLIGSTSEHCVANAHCPVVVFRQHE